MKQKLKAKKDMVKQAKMLDGASPLDPFYFNTGCGFHSKITCIEISAGKIYLRLLGYDKEGKIDFNSYVNTAELKDY